MTKQYEITALAKNTVFHRAATFLLDGDNKFSVSSRSSSREYHDEADAIACFHAYATQGEAAAFTAHTDVVFELDEISENEEGDYVQRVLKSVAFKVEA